LKPEDLKNRKKDSIPQQRKPQKLIKEEESKNETKADAEEDQDHE